MKTSFIFIYGFDPLLKNFLYTCIHKKNFLQFCLVTFSVMFTLFIRYICLSIYSYILFSISLYIYIYCEVTFSVILMSYKNKY